MKKLELLGARKCGRVHIESAVYFSNFPRSQCKTFQVLTSTEFPASCFIFSDNQTALVADISFREFPGCLKAFYQRKKKLQVEAKGIKYQLGDFTVSFITLFMGQSASVKGYLIEVCFHASCMIHLCRDILKAFITQVLPDICPPANSSTEHIFSPSFLQAVETGTFDAPRWPPSQLNFPVENNFLQDDSPLSHVCVRLTMTQYAEHINIVRRLSRQSINTPNAVTTNGLAAYATPPTNPSGQTNKNIPSNYCT
ncbi:mediator of RNA polymerase II transcription subunit 20 [Schistosoma japonicum]|nr:mediator of RNA polymerase II transcription subunit 20 [Schistosoma japonicum]